MARGKRIDVAGHYYHVINRSNLKLQIFNSDSDYLDFINILRRALDIVPVNIYSYCVMPNHWHFLLSPNKDGDIGRFMHSLTNTHTRVVHSKTETVGFGPLYQGRYKSMMIDSDISFLKVFRYVERNPVRAGLEVYPDEWKWGSSWLRKNGSSTQKEIITNIPIEITNDYGDVYEYTLIPDNEDDIKMIRSSIIKNSPFGREKWVDRIVKNYGIESTLGSVGRKRQF